MDKSLWRCSTFELVDSRYIYREESASLMSQTKSKGPTYTNPRPGQYPAHVHSHVTRAVAAMESCFALTGAHQHGSLMSHFAHNIYLSTLQIKT